LRFGKGVRGLPPLKAIRLKCLDCTGGSPKEVKACDPTFDHCTLWLFRFGTNPNFSEAAREQRRARLQERMKKSPHHNPIRTQREAG
jgi:hypothetical protein